MSERSITQQVFGKGIEKVSYADVVNYFSKPRSESDRIEFKSYVVGKNDKGPKAHLEEVYQSLSGMLNSEGGLLIWGAPIGEYPAGSKEKVFVGPLTDVQCDRDDDQLNSGILDNLNPMPPNIRHMKLTKGRSRAYIFEVPKSPYAPHQLKGTYYARFGSQTRVAPHYLVEALMRRVTFPNIAAYVQLKSVVEEQTRVVVSFTISCVNHSRLQNERNITITAAVSHGSFPWNTFTPKNFEISSGGKMLIITDSRDLLHYGVNHHLPFDVNIPHESRPSDNELVIQVAVGGRFSPMKYSTYIIDLDSGHTTAATRIRPIKVNILANEDEDSMIERELRRLRGA